MQFATQQIEMSPPSESALLIQPVPWWQRRKVGAQDLLAVTHQLASLLKSGISFSGAMEILLLPGVHRPATRAMLEELAKRVRDGEPLSSAMSSRPDVFDELYLTLVEAGEVSAKLPEILTRLAEFQEKKTALRQKTIGALLYPLFVLGFGLTMGTVMVVYGAPLLEDMYRSSGTQLPWLSSLVFDIGRMAGRLFLLLLVLITLLLPFLYSLMKRPAFRCSVDHFFLTWSLTSELVQQTTAARCARTLSVLYRNGVPILKALELTGRSSGNLIYRDLFEQTAKDVKDGSLVSLPLLCSPYFPSMAAGMVAAGEESGNLAEMLEHVADHYESQVDFTLQAMLKFLEPMLIIGVGIVIGFVVVALGIPFMNLMSVLA